MKKIVLSSILLVVSSASMAGSLDCYRYVDGKPTGGYVNVEASSKSEASAKAMQKYRDMGMKTDYVNCRW